MFVVEEVLELLFKCLNVRNRMMLNRVVNVCGESGW